MAINKGPQPPQPTPQHPRPTPQPPQPNKPIIHSVDPPQPRVPKQP